MIQVEAAFSQMGKDLGLVGRYDENKTREIIFDCADILSEYPEAVIECAVQRVKDADAYLADVVTDGTKRIIVLTEADVYYPGLLRIELRAKISADRRKSATYTAQVVDSLRGQADKPGNPVPDSLNRLNETLGNAQKIEKTLELAVADADAATIRANESASNADKSAENADAAKERTEETTERAEEAITETNTATEAAKAATSAAQAAAASITFLTFEVSTDDGHLYVNNPERISGIGFEIDENGYLEVVVNG